MQLRAISYQWGKGRENEKFSDVYEDVIAKEGANWWQKKAKTILVLLRYLEDNIDAPPHWISTTHLNCCFYENDRVECKLSETAEMQKLTIQELTWDRRNKLAIVVPINLGDLISIAKIRSGDLESSGQLIGEILRGEVTFAATRK